MSDEVARQLIARLPLRQRAQEENLYEQDPDRWLRRKGLPQFGYNLYGYLNNLKGMRLGNYATRREAEQAMQQDVRGSAYDSAVGRLA